MIRGMVLATAVAAGLAVIPAVTQAAVPVALALRTNMPQLNVKDAPLEKVIDRLRDFSGGNIVVNWKALEEAGVTKESPITLTVADVSLRRALNLVLDEAGGTADLAIMVDNSVIRITSQAEADKHMVTVIYPVGDLILPKNTTLNVPNFAQMNNNNNNNGNNNGIMGGGVGVGGAGGGGGLFGNNNNHNNMTHGVNNQNNQNNQNNSSVSNYFTTTDDKAGQALVDLVVSMVRPEIWDKNGGKATARLYENMLIVTAPISVQEMVGGSVYTTQNRRYGW